MRVSFEANIEVNCQEIRNIKVIEILVGLIHSDDRELQFAAANAVRNVRHAIK